MDLLSPLKKVKDYVDDNPVETGLTLLSLIPGGKAAKTAAKTGPKFAAFADDLSDLNGMMSDSFDNARKAAQEVSDAAVRKMNLIAHIRKNMATVTRIKPSAIQEDPKLLDKFVTKTLPRLATTKGEYQPHIMETPWPGIRIVEAGSGAHPVGGLERAYTHNGHWNRTLNGGELPDPSWEKVWNVVDETGTFPGLPEAPGVIGSFDTIAGSGDQFTGLLDQAHVIEQARGSALGGSLGSLADTVLSARLAALRGMTPDFTKPKVESMMNPFSAMPIARSLAAGELRPNLGLSENVAGNLWNDLYHNQNLAKTDDEWHLIRSVMDKLNRPYTQSPEGVFGFASGGVPIITPELIQEALLRRAALTRLDSVTQKGVM